MNRKSLILSLTMLMATMLVISGCAAKKPAEVAAPVAIDGYASITTDVLKENIGKPEWIVVDARQTDAFNGWKLDGLEKGGHIKGATDFSALWLDVKGDTVAQRLAETLTTKGITPEKNVVLYDANGLDAKRVADYLKGLGYKNISLYDVKEWVKDSSLEMVSNKNYQMIVPAQWIKDVVDGKNPETFAGGEYKIFEVSWGDETTSYVNGHIPNAVHINTDEEEKAPLWSLNSDAELIQFAKNNGITLNQTVILEGADPMASYRVAAILKYLGVKDVRVLNGGFESWVRAGYEVEKASHPKVAVADFGATEPQNKGYIINIDQAKAVLADKSNSILVDIRSWEEHIGAITGYSDLKFKGRPAGAVWGQAGTDPNHLESYRNVDNTMRNADEIVAMWAAQGITTDKTLSFFCGSGWRAAEVEFMADSMGVEKISMYANGWYEWSADSKNPVEIGEPKK
jgi:3-mercaptopyruvate sulfurtransferase SseA